jgi:hypothetical protein
MSTGASSHPSWTSWGCPSCTWLDVKRFPPSPVWSEARERTTTLHHWHFEFFAHILYKSRNQRVGPKE